MIRTLQVTLTILALIVAAPFIVLALAVAAIGAAWEQR